MSETVLEVYRAWRERNPLRRWRRREGMSIAGTAGYLGVSFSAIQQWEAGSGIPGPENMQRIAEALCLTHTSLIEEWKEWHRSRPKVRSAV